MKWSNETITKITLKSTISLRGRASYIPVTGLGGP
jgi:hypothetical protein